MIRVIGYGSLLNKKSFERTLQWREPQLIWVHGYKRVFNLVPYRMKFYKDADNIHATVVNVVPDEDSKFNAIMFEISEDELEKLKIREISYRTKKVKVRNFANDEDMGEAILFIGKKQRFGEDIIDNSLLPIKTYLEICRSGAYSFGREFGDAWKNTTFMGDGRCINDNI